MEQTGRNELCPCGSGKKYKKCCFLKKKSYDLGPFYFKLFSISIISCLGILAYSNTFHSSFHLDDFPFIVDNPYITNLHNLLNSWKFYPSRFVTILSIALNYHFDGFDVVGYHIFNLGVHLVSAILVWWLTLLTLSTPAFKDPAHGGAGNKITQHAGLIALLAGLVFVSHPVQTQAVTYIWQRAASMTAMFYLASLCFYVKSRLLQDQGSTSNLGKFYYILSLITAIVAMFSKENAITLPLIIFLYEFSFLKNKKAFNWGYSIPFFLIIFIFLLTTPFTKSQMSPNMNNTGENGPAMITPMHYLLTQFRVIVTYIRLAFVPIHQNLDYDFPVYTNIIEWPVLTSFLFLMTILYFAIRLFSKYRLVSFCIFWFFLTLMPESSFLPLKDVIFEHRLYLPLAGYSIFLVSGMYDLLGKKSIPVMVTVLTMAVAFNAVLTYQRNEIWKNEFTLWDDTVRKSPHKARPYLYRGLSFITQKNYTKAEADFTKAIELDPGYTDAYYNRGLTYDNLGKYDEAIPDLTKTIELNPDYPNVYYDRGLTYDSQGKSHEAISDFTKAIKQNPKDAEAFFNRAMLYGKEKMYEQAISDYVNAIKIDPNNKAAYNNLADVYYQLKEYDKAWDNLHKAEELGYSVNPEFIKALRSAAKGLGE